MQELNMTEIDQVGGAGKLGITLLGVSAGIETTKSGVNLELNALGFPLFVLELPLVIG